MKTKLLLGLFILLLASATLATPQPLPLAVQVVIDSNVLPAANVDLTFKHSPSNIQFTSKTDDSGYAVLELSNYPTTSGTLEIIINVCSSLPECHKSVAITGNPMTVIFNVLSTTMTDEPTPLPITNVVYAYVCWDGTQTAIASQCPVQPVYKACEDGSRILETETCPVTASYAWLWGIFATLAALLLGAGGWKFYNGKFKHYHNGITGYHDPNTQHSNPKYKHAAFNKHPFKCISDIKKIQKGIDLSLEQSA